MAMIPRVWWLGAITDWCGPAALPRRRSPAIGEHYPWHVVAEYSTSRGHAEAVHAARRVLDRLPDCDWRVGCSAGKDSTALAVLMAEDGIGIAGFSVKDDLDYPGEREYIRALAAYTGTEIEVLVPESSLVEYLRAGDVSLVDDVHGRSAGLSRTFFYGLLNAHRAHHGYDGILMGLRSEESKARAGFLRSQGPIYRRKDGVTTASPLAEWTDLDVHAYLWSRRVPVLHVYGCVDPGSDDRALRLRKSWFVAGAAMANLGHYTWLRRWWPTQWRLAVSIDPNVERFT